MPVSLLEPITITSVLTSNSWLLTPDLQIFLPARVLSLPPA